MSILINYRLTAAEGEGWSIDGHAGVQDHLEDIQTAGQIPRLGTETHGQVLIRTCQSQVHEDGQVEFGSKRHHQDKGDADHPELGAVGVHLGGVAKQFHRSNKTEKQNIISRFSNETVV